MLGGGIKINDVCKFFYTISYYYLLFKINWKALHMEFISSTVLTISYAQNHEISLIWHFKIQIIFQGTALHNHRRTHGHFPPSAPDTQNQAHSIAYTVQNITHQTSTQWTNYDVYVMCSATQSRNHVSNGCKKKWF